MSSTDFEKRTQALRCTRRRRRRHSILGWPQVRSDGAGAVRRERWSCYDAINACRNCTMDCLMDFWSYTRRLSRYLTRHQWMRFGAPVICVALVLICSGLSCSSTSTGVDSGALGGRGGGAAGSGGGMAGAAGGTAGSGGGAAGAGGGSGRGGASSGGSGGTTGAAGNAAAGTGGGGGGSATCGGRTCQSDEFCCGPPACGECKKTLTGPVCPTAC